MEKQTVSEHHGHHDIGGEPTGPIGRTEHKHALWEKRVDALLMLLSDKKRDFVRVDEAALAGIVTRDCMIGVAVPRSEALV